LTHRLQTCTSAPPYSSSASILLSQHVRDLGVILDSDLTLTAHVSQIVSVCYFHLRQLRLIRRSLTADTAHIMVRALIHICLDYCNSLLFGLPAGQIAWLQGLPVGYRALSAQLCVSLCSHGWIFHNKSHINLLCWCTNVHTVWHRNISWEHVFSCLLYRVVLGGQQTFRTEIAHSFHRPSGVLLVGCCCCEADKELVWEQRTGV